jgi:transcription termination factor NusB
MFKNRRASRAIFVEFIYANLFGLVSLSILLEVLQIDEEDFSVNSDYLNKLMKSFDENKDKIYALVEKYNNRKQNIDQVILSIIIASTTEMFINNSNVVIAEYMKISDILGCNTNFVNGILDIIKKDEIILQIQEDIKEEMNIENKPKEEMNIENKPKEI